MKKLINFFFVMFSMITGLSSQVYRAFSSSEVEATLISSVTATGNQEVILLGLKIKTPQGWKLYAPESDEKNPFKRHPQLDLKKSNNLKSLKISWPQATVKQEGGEKVFVYDNHVIIPLWAELEDPNLPLQLEGSVSFIACHDQCVPYEIPVSLSLAQGVAVATPQAQLIKDYQLGTFFKDTLELEEASLWFMLLIAFVAGFVLNFMPCVLPVLSLKLKSLARPGYHHFRANFLATFIGILTSFMAYGVIAILLKAGGQSLGWGLHFQEPLFLVVMALVMTLFTASLWGGLDIHLSAPLQTKINHLIYHQKQQVRLYAEGFLSGVFATLLATPCTAPFLGTTLGYALSHGPLEILSLFLMLGLGFATPYWLGLIVPARLIPLPKAGGWLEWVSKGLGLGLLGTTLWLMYLFYQLQGPLVTTLISVTLGLLFSSFFLRKRYSFLSKAFVPLSLIALAIPFGVEGQSQLQEHYQEALIQPFEPEKIPDLIAKGKIVVIDITASWCATCQLNKVLAFRDEVIMERLENPQVVFMQGDWTSRNDTIRSYINRYKRYGIPFNQVFGPQAPQGILLPELFTQNAWLQAFEEAGYKEAEK